ncbi:MAG: manganese efflux pump MntP family protein, partial [Oscillospiraceae bacterium]|nr:manganese efflux pump MntP family protein [Oscillospiraceae bacterium]
SILELFVIALALSMDAFAVSVCAGLAMGKAKLRQAAAVGLYFGGFQAAMPLIGYVAGSQISGITGEFSHWAAFGLLCFIGGKMIRESRAEDARVSGDAPVSPRKMLPLAVATSIDALAVGVSFALTDVRIIPAVSLIGAVTFFVSAAGVMFGGFFGAGHRAKAEFAGGAVLIIIGLKILLEGLGIF